MIWVITERLSPESVIILVPIGVAAMNNDSRTLHSALTLLTNLNLFSVLCDSSALYEQCVLYDYWPVFSDLL